MIQIALGILLAYVIYSFVFALLDGCSNDAYYRKIQRDIKKRQEAEKKD